MNKISAFIESFCMVVIPLVLAIYFIHSLNYKPQTQEQDIKEVTISSDLIKIEMTIDLTNLNYEKTHLKGIKVTAYNNEKRQTDSTPNTTASNRIVYEGSVAVSSDLRKKYDLKFGDIVYIPHLNKYFIFEDGMANGLKDGERTITNTIDVFMYSKDTAKFFRLLNQEVILYKLPRNQ